MVLVDGSRSVQTISFDGTQFTAGGAASVLEPTGGSLAGTLKVRDGSLQQTRDDLDRLSAQLVSSVNRAYNPFSSSSNFFVPGGTTAGTISLSAGMTALDIRATEWGSAGSNDIAQAVALIGEQNHSIGSGDLIDGTLGDFHRQMVTRVGGEVAAASDRVSDQETVQDMLLSRRDSISGVSLDEEMADLLRYQRAFEASARVMRVIDEMLELVVTGLVR